MRTWRLGERIFLTHGRREHGRRRALLRLTEEWIRQEHPELRIIEADLWEAVQQRLAFVERTYGLGLGQPPHGGARAG